MMHRLNGTHLSIFIITVPGPKFLIGRNIMTNCECKKDHNHGLSRLEVLTDLVEFAEQRRAEGSLYTGGWADSYTVSKWMETIGYLRVALPECAVKCFDEERRRKRELVARLQGEFDAKLQGGGG